MDMCVKIDNYAARSCENNSGEPGPEHPPFN